MPEVEIVILRSLIPTASGSHRIRVAFRTLGRFSSGSPIPIITMLKRLLSPCQQAIVLATNSTWPTISPAVSDRSSPISAVMQNLQSTGHPTWLEIQTVSRSPSGIRTVSTVRPSLRRNKYRRVPSSDS